MTSNLPSMRRLSLMSATESFMVLASTRSDKSDLDEKRDGKGRRHQSQDEP